MSEKKQKKKFRALSFDNQKYEFVESFNPMDESIDAKFYAENILELKKQKKEKRINKIKLNIFKILFFTFFICFIITLKLLLSRNHEYNLLEKKLMDHIFSPYHSDLILNLNVLRQLKTWIRGSLFNTTGKVYNLSLSMCYKATINGDSCDNFHLHTDGANGYVIIIQDTDLNIFGGYTSKNFKANHLVNLTYPLTKRDDNSFLFSLSENEIYPVLKNASRFVIYADDEEGPIFGNFPFADIRIVTNFLSHKCQTNFPNFYADVNGNKNHNIKLKLTKGKKEFFVKELEIFKVNFK